MNTVRSAKMVGIICIVAVLSAMYSGILAVFIMLFGALPAAVICRKKMNKEETAVADLLTRNHSDWAFKGECFEGIGDLKQTDECLLFFGAKGINICRGNDEHIMLPIAKVKDIRIYTLQEIMEVADSGLQMSLGRMGDVMGSSEKRPGLKQNQEVRYLIIRAVNKKGESFIVSFYAPLEYANFNRIAMKNRREL